ncbi:ferritin-like domain-containing protein [Nostoc sp. 'Peltigera membranacea cyanobiont' N6]|uniref:ferritin-like domain-containing protein n=1 Tax=Nostoc sp. 'Peltigera membranacea cyanobiont' N6 TaxID=1261031 RepID=UPI000CF351FB|nr:ferritin-like domain-containing protein [Nostoc sp. 'Peltigera membranacea cyanobiont' N6]AVH64385.1 ferritin-like protein [Nostoc sp. 'Peltigera membranacea cyanobiont' N6]
MDSKYNIVGFDLPHTDSDDRLRRILTAALSNQKNYDNYPQLNYWDAEFFNLHQVQIFQQSNNDEQFSILELANRSLLEESYFIEKAGVGYMAKMVLLAETVEERMLYALFTADEATHLHQISYFLPEMEVSSTDDPFLRLLSEVVESADKTVLLFVLQVVLEGWGLSHYRRLAKECRYPVLAELFSSFLQSESRHHATGTTLFNQITVSAFSETTILDVLAQFLFMVQVGPQSLLTAIEQVKGHLTRSQKIQILEELDTETHSGTRLEILRSLMGGTSAQSILQNLEERGAFKPLPAHQCV